MADQWSPATASTYARIRISGSSTVTYLFDGEIMHRDSLGTAVPIRPGEVNWMTAGRGIAHSERNGAERRAKGATLHGLQMWVALPAAKEEMEPAFAHHAVDEFPMVADDGTSVRVVVGGAYGTRSRGRVSASETLFWPTARFLKAGSHDAARRRARRARRST